MRNEVIIRIPEKSNKERELAEVLKQAIGRKLKDVKIENGFFCFEFFDNCYFDTTKYAVKQFSKKRYECDTQAIVRFLEKNGCKYISSVNSWQVMKVIDLPDEWIIFFKRGRMI